MHLFDAALSKGWEGLLTFERACGSRRFLHPSPPQPQVIRISKGVNCRGAVLRDVGTYAVSITGVGLCFLSGVVRLGCEAGRRPRV